VRWIICHNPEEAERDAAAREAAITRITAELDRITATRARAREQARAHRSTTGSAAARKKAERQTEQDEAAHVRAECTLRDHPALGRWLRQTPPGRLVLDKAKIAAEERLDGKYLLSTSDPDLPAEDVALGYKNLLEAERGFRDLKSTIELRPVFHRLEPRIRAHVLLCWLALLLIRVAERRTGMTWRRIAIELGRLHALTLVGPAGTVVQTIEPTTAQLGILRACELFPPRRITTLDPPEQRKHTHRPVIGAWTHTPINAASPFPKVKRRSQLSRLPTNCGRRGLRRAGFVEGGERLSQLAVPRVAHLADIQDARYRPAGPDQHQLVVLVLGRPGGVQRVDTGCREEGHGRQVDYQVPGVSADRFAQLVTQYWCRSDVDLTGRRAHSDARLRIAQGRGQQLRPLVAAVVWWCARSNDGPSTTRRGVRVPACSQRASRPTRRENSCCCRYLSSSDGGVHVVAVQPGPYARVGLRSGLVTHCSLFARRSHSDCGVSRHGIPAEPSSWAHRR
jgi:hypothetical protein